MNRFFEMNRSFVLAFMMACLAIPFLWILKPFWLTLILGLVFAVSLEPLLDKLEKRMKTHSEWALVIILVSLVLIVIIPFGLVLLKGVQMLWFHLQKFATPEYLDKIKVYQSDLLGRLEILKDYGIDPHIIQESMWTAGQNVGTKITSILGDTLSAVPEMLMLSFVLLLSIISFLMMRQDFRRVANKITWISKPGLTQLITTFQNCCRSVVISTLVTGAIQAGITTIGAWIFTDYDGLMVFFITFVLSFIPIIGAGPVSLVMAIIAFSESQWGSGIGLMVFFAVTSVADNIIRPWILAGSTQIPSIWALFCTIGAIVMFGLPGLFIGPLIGALAIEIIPILAEEYKRS